MLLEILIMLEIVAFCFLALGIMPISRSYDFEGNENKPPYLNKIIYVFVSAILFFSLGVVSASYDYNYCYIYQTTADYTLNMSTSLATCASYAIENTALSYLNFGIGVIAIVIALILLLFASTSKDVFGG